MNKIIEAIWVTLSGLSIFWFISKLNNIYDVSALIILSLVWCSWIKQKTKEKGAKHE